MASTGLLTPPTILPKTVSLWVGRIRHGWCAVDPEHDIDVVMVDLDPLDQEADQFALHVPVDLGHPLANALGEVLQPPDHQ